MGELEGASGPADRFLGPIHLGVLQDVLCFRNFDRKFQEKLVGIAIQCYRCSFVFVSDLFFPFPYRFRLVPFPFRRFFDISETKLCEMGISVTIFTLGASANGW